MKEIEPMLRINKQYSKEANPDNNSWRENMKLNMKLKQKD